jgi:hypothetical protein
VEILVPERGEQERDAGQPSKRSAGVARNPLRIAEWGLRNPQSEIRIPKFLPPGSDP